MMRNQKLYNKEKVPKERGRLEFMTINDHSGAALGRAAYYINGRY